MSFDMRFLRSRMPRTTPGTEYRHTHTHTTPLKLNFGKRPKACNDSIWKVIIKGDLQSRSLEAIHQQRYSKGKEDLQPASFVNYEAQG